MGVLDFFSKGKNKENLDKGLEKTKSNFFSNLKKAVIGKDKVDDQVLDDLGRSVDWFGCRCRYYT